MHCGPTPRRREIDIGALVMNPCTTAHLLAHLGNHRLRELHHSDVVGVGLIHLNRGELRVMAGAHSLVPEDPTELVHPLKPAHHKPLEV